MAETTIATNRKARHDFHILETVEAGLVLTGSEIKSIRAGRLSLKEAHAVIENGEAWLVGAHIASYPMAGYADHDPTRRRKLLLHKRQILQLAFDVQAKGHALVPLRLYLRDGIAKLELALAKGKKLHDKRQDIRERDTKRDIERQLRQRR